MPLSEETVGGLSLPPTVTLTVKEATMEKVKLAKIAVFDTIILSADIPPSSLRNAAVQGVSLSFCHTLA